MFAAVLPKRPQKMDQGTGGWPDSPQRSPVNTEGGAAGQRGQLASSWAQALAGWQGWGREHSKASRGRADTTGVRGEWEACNGEPAAARNRSSQQVTALQYSRFKDWMLLFLPWKRNLKPGSPGPTRQSHCGSAVLGSLEPSSPLSLHEACVCSGGPNSVRPRGL